MELVKQWYGRWMEDWEHHLAFRSTDRVVRPFDWGIEWTRGWPFHSHETDPEKNPLWAFHETFNADTAWVEEHRDLYKNGKIGDVAIKLKLIDVINALIGPIRERRKQFEQRPDDVIDILRAGTVRANAVAEETLALAKKAMKQDYFGRKLTIG